MSKAIMGAALLAGAVGFAAIMTGGFSLAGILALTSTSMDIMGALALGGVAMEAGAIADALTSNRGMAITTRQAAANRQIIYGVQRVGGVEIYRSTTGSRHDQFNYVIVLAGHECYAIENLYLDGRQVYWDTGSSGHSTRNGYGFGGNSDGNTHYGPNGVAYNFGSNGHGPSMVYCEARWGDQSPGDVIGGLTANDGNWAASAGNSPWVGGCTYVYLKVEYDAGMFPQEPEIRFTVHGKNNIYDPRISENGFTVNSALISADIISDTVFGLGDPTINEAQLIAAANVCDEQVAVEALIATSGTESRYAANTHYDTGTAPSDALANVMKTMGGRLSRIGGQWYIWPAYWQGPSFSFDANVLTAEMEWTPTRSYRELFNRVTGTYTAPGFPFNIAGNLYDANGYYNGGTQNNFPFAFQPTNYPQYAQDVLHGYAADTWLNQDSLVTGTFALGTVYAVGAVVSYNGTVYTSLVNSNTGHNPVGGPSDTYWALSAVALPFELSLPAVLSVTQAQRLAKIALLRNRWQGTGKMEMSLKAWQMQPVDVMNFTFPSNGWQDKPLEISSVRFKIDKTNDKAPSVRVSFEVNETDSSIYEWNPATEELTISDVPAGVTTRTYVVPPPTSMSLSSGASTAVTAIDGTVTPRIEVQWTPPADAYVAFVQVQHQLTGATPWTDDGNVDVSSSFVFISSVVSGQDYNVRIRAIRNNGATSAWVEIDGFTAGLTLNSQTQDGVGIGSLIGEAYSDGTAGIECNPFTALIGQLALSIFPAGEVTITGLAQQTLYYVYYIDANCVGGNVTPIATQNKADFLGKNGYWLIDSIVTPFNGGGGSPGGRFYPTTFSDIGRRTTQFPGYAYDGNLGTSAVVSGRDDTTSPTGILRNSNLLGWITWSGFPSNISASDRTLYIIADFTLTNTGTASGGEMDLSAVVTGTTASVATLTSTTANTTYTVDIPAGTDISSVAISVLIQPGIGTTIGDSSEADSRVTEIYIQ